MDERPALPMEGGPDWAMSEDLKSEGPGDGDREETLSSSGVWTVNQTATWCQHDRDSADVGA